MMNMGLGRDRPLLDPRVEGGGGNGGTGQPRGEGAVLYDPGVIHDDSHRPTPGEDGSNPTDYGDATEAGA